MIRNFSLNGLGLTCMETSSLYRKMLVFGRIVPEILIWQVRMQGPLSSFRSLLSRPRKRKEELVNFIRFSLGQNWPKNSPISSNDLFPDDSTDSKDLAGELDYLFRFMTWMDLSQEEEVKNHIEDEILEGLSLLRPFWILLMISMISWWRIRRIPSSSIQHPSKAYPFCSRSQKQFPLQAWPIFSENDRNWICFRNTGLSQSLFVVVGCHSLCLLVLYRRDLLLPVT